IPGQADFPAGSPLGAQGLWRPDGAGGRAGPCLPAAGGSHGSSEVTLELAVLECQYQFHSCCWICSTLQGLQVFGKAAIQTVGSCTSVAATVRPEESALKVKEEESGREQVAEGKVHEGDRPDQTVSFLVSRPLSLCRFPVAFMDSPERSCGVSSSRTLVNLHNNEAGRKSEGAAEVYPKRVGSHKLLVPKSSRFKPCTAHDLVYLRASPEFCGRDPRHGILGTSGGQCSWTWLAMAGWELLCSAGLPTARAERCRAAAASSAGAAPSSAGSAGPSWSCTGAAEGPQSAGQVSRGAISSCVLPTQHPPVSRPMLC
ncbi:hypothetical protein IHE44_0005709, partial [Lamprotornis superbus]